MHNMRMDLRMCMCTHQQCTYSSGPCEVINASFSQCTVTVPGVETDNPPVVRPRPSLFLLHFSFVFLFLPLPIHKIPPTARGRYF